jgi:hypothetical protein
MADYTSTIPSTNIMASFHVTRSVTRRNNQLAMFAAKMNEYALTKNEIIDIVTTAMQCPDMLATNPTLRVSTNSAVIGITLIHIYHNDQRIIALKEVFDMFMESLVTRPDYKE